MPPHVQGSLETQLGSSPMSSLGVVPDSVTSFDSNSLGKATTLLLFLGQESLDAERLVRRHGEANSTTRRIARKRGGSR